MTKQIIHQQSAIQSLVYSLSLPSPHSPNHRGTHPLSIYTQSQDQETRTWLCRAFQARHMQSLSEFVICLPQRKTRAYIIGGNLCCAASKAMQSWWTFFVTIVPTGSMVQNFCIQYIYCTLHQDQFSACARCAFLWLVKKREEQRVRINQETKTKSNLFLSVSLFLGVSLLFKTTGPCMDAACLVLPVLLLHNQYA